MQAGNAAANFLGLAPAVRVLPVEPDEPQVMAAKELLRTQRQLQQIVTSGFGGVLTGMNGSGSRISRSWNAGTNAAVPTTKAAAPSQPTPPNSAQADASSESSSSDTVSGRDLSLLQQDEQLQEMLRDEVVAQVTEQQQQQQASVT